MALFKCKMCGGSLEIAAGTSVIECEYCGTKQTLPKLDDAKRANLYDRANHFRRNNEFDKAMGIYEQILNEDNTDAEAYWSLVLCRYGIEYVEDPASHKRIPTVNRTQFTSIFDDADYKAALENADTLQRSVYEAEAKAINEIQKGVLSISQNEDPFDVFICYKETDNNGRRTPDSVLAQDLYFGLKNEGFKVFFARITLEDKLGSAYEPYIFAALNSAKVMVVLGTKPEYFNAVWVKNEWSRYLALIKQGKKKTLIPAYRDMDPYDLPEEFSHLQAQDMSKLGFMQDLIRGIQKIVKADERKQTVVKVYEQRPPVVKDVVTANRAANAAPLLKRAFMFLEDGEWDSAKKYCEKVLDMDPENAEAYLGKLMAELHTKNRDMLRDCSAPFDNKNNYQKAIRFANKALKAELEGYIEYIKTRNENARKEKIYTQATNDMNSATYEAEYKNAAALFNSVLGYKDAGALKEICVEKAEFARKDRIYGSAKVKMNEDRISSYQEAITMFRSIISWKDSEEQITICEREIQALTAERERQAELERQERERQAEIMRQEELRRAKIRRNCKIGFGIFVVIATAINIYFAHNAIAVPFYNSLEGRDIFTGWASVLWPSWISIAATLLATRVLGNLLLNESKPGTIAMFFEVIVLLVYAFVLGCIFPPNDSVIENILGNIAILAFSHAIPAVIGICIGRVISKKTSLKKIIVLIIVLLAILAIIFFIPKTPQVTADTLPNLYNQAVAMMEAERYGEAIAVFKDLDGYRDSRSKKAECENLHGLQLISQGEYKTAISKYGITKIVIPEGTTEIKAEAFSDTKISSIKIPNSVTNIGEKAFYNCDSLTSVLIPDSVKNIGKYAFGSCQSLTNVTIGNSVTNISDGAFSNCESLAGVTIPNSVTSIGEHAFWGSGLTSITIPSSVTSIGEYVFSECRKLKSITFEGTMEEWRAFSKIPIVNTHVPVTKIVCSDGTVKRSSQ